MSKTSNIKRLMHRYEEHVGDTAGNPYMFFDHLGNELELHNDDGKSITNISKALDNIRKEPYYRYPISYSTYNTFIKYPVDILGVNMLDSGDVYWRDGLSHIKSLNIPFYASEFGGFVAFFEHTPNFLRIHRMYENWQNLLDHGALGAAFFQSHDNWAQPVPVGYNDPFDNEMPDDLRGFWDIENKPKAELNHLSTILSDIDFKYLGNSQLEFLNRRKFQLNDIHLLFNGEPVAIEKLVPGQSSVIDLKSESRFIEIKATYFTHLGFKNQIEFTFDTNAGMRPRLLTSTKLLDVKQLVNQTHWGNFTENNVHGGPVILRLTLPDNLLENSFLVLGGVGSQKIRFANLVGDKSVIVNVHNYREQIFRIMDLKTELGDVREVIVEIFRDQVRYLAESDGRNIPITLQKPIIYNPIVAD